MSEPLRKNKAYHATSDDPGFMSAEDKSKLDLVTATGSVNLDTLDSNVTTLQSEMNAVEDVLTVAQITLSASSTTDGMDITIQFNDADGTKIAEPVLFELWISEAATGLGLTADTASGDFTVGTGTEWEEIVTKKHYRCISDASGDFVATLVDSANPTDQYVVVVNPVNGTLDVSAASGTNWEGA